MKKSLFYYISYIEKSKWSGEEKYPDLELVLLNSYEEAFKFIQEQYDQLLSFKNIDDYPNNLEPSIITNDLRLIMKYRTAFSQTEFKLWCGIDVDKVEIRNYFNIEWGIYGDVRLEFYNHFQDLIKGKISNAYTRKIIEPVYDDQLGYVGEDVNDKGWQINPIVSNPQIPIEINPVSVENDRIIWWNSLSPLWKKIFKDLINHGFYLNLPTPEVLSEIFQLKEFYIERAFYSRYGGSTFREHKGIDITPLSYLQNLEIIDLRDMEVAHPEQIGRLVNLKEINFEGNNLKSMEFFGTLPKLEVLNISKNSIKNLNGIEKCTKLKKLDFSGNDVNSLWPLLKLKNLVDLSCSSNKLKNLIPLPSVQKIHAINNLFCKEEVNEFLAMSKYRTSISLHNFISKW